MKWNSLMILQLILKRITKFGIIADVSWKFIKKISKKIKKYLEKFLKAMQRTITLGATEFG
jgi:hypothetical protein